MNGDIQTIRLYNLKIHSNGTPYDALADTNLNSRLARISPQRDKMAMIMVHSPVLEIVHIGERNSRKFLLDANPPPGTFDLDMLHNGTLTKYFQGIDVTENYIYLLSDNEKNMDSEKKQTIKVLDWDGQPRYQYTIPEQYQLGMLVVNEEKNEFYGLSYEDDKIYQFNYFFE